MKTLQITEVKTLGGKGQKYYLDKGWRMVSIKSYENEWDKANEYFNKGYKVKVFKATTMIKGWYDYFLFVKFDEKRVQLEYELEQQAEKELAEEIKTVEEIKEEKLSELLLNEKLVWNDGASISIGIEHYIGWIEKEKGIIKFNQDVISYLDFIVDDFEIDAIGHMSVKLKKKEVKLS